MLETQPKTWVWFVWMVAALGCYQLSRVLPEGWTLLAGGLAVIAGVVSLVELLYWILWRVTTRVRLLLEARATTTQVLIYREYARLSEYHLKTLQVLSPLVVFLPGDPFPIAFYLRLNGDEVPMGFVHEFFDLSGDAYLYPVGSYPEGTNKRRWAFILTNHIVSQGYAEAAAGNRPAKWLDRAGAMRWLLVDQEVVL